MTEKRPEPGFNLVHDVYDHVKFLRNVAERLVVKAKLAPGQRVLDVACGTGWATMAAARAVGNNGRVTGIDIAEKMLDVARAKTASAGLSNADYRVGDAEMLGFDKASFDAVICASSIFFLRDIPKALREWHRVLKTGGTLAFTSFGVGYMQPLSKLFNERLAQYEGLAQSGQSPTARTDTPEKCRELLKQAGLAEIKIATEQPGYYFEDAQAYWQETTSTIIKLRLIRLSPAQLEQFKKEHLAEVESLRTDKGIWMNAPVHFSIAKKKA